jgi:hypothetical protein
MFLSGSFNRFRFYFPKVFIPDEIADKYRPLIQRIPGCMIQEPIDFLNYAIQSIDVSVKTPYEPTTQIDRGTTWGRLGRAMRDPRVWLNRDMTISFQLDSAYIIWSILTEIFMYYYCAEPDPKFIPATPGMEILDCYNRSLYRITFDDLLFTGVSGLEFDFSSNEVDQKIVTTNWRANKVNVVLEPARV